MEQLIGVGCFAALGLMCLVFAEKKASPIRIKIQHVEHKPLMVPIAEVPDRIQEREEI